ncbi:MAG: hypothetical protein KGL73_02030 [Burkholderiales bacterium]|nr:hypothetical protein [Burkholderiales bacterium]
MKKVGWLCSLLLVLAMPAVHAEEERFVDKAARTTKKGGEAAEQGIQKGASATNKAVGKAFDVVNDKVFKPADRWIQDKAAGKKSGAEKSADK